MITLKSNNLDYYLSVLPSRVLLMIASPTCPLCKKVVPEIDKQLGDDIEVLYIDGEKWPKIADKYDIKWYPTLILLEDGTETRRIEKVNEKKLRQIIK